VVSSVNPAIASYLSVTSRLIFLTLRVGTRHSLLCICDSALTRHFFFIQHRERHFHKKKKRMDWLVEATKIEFVSSKAGGAIVLCELSIDKLHLHMRPFYLAMICGALPCPSQFIFPVNGIIHIVMEDTTGIDVEGLEGFPQILCKCRSCKHAAGGPNPVLRSSSPDGNTQEFFFTCGDCREINWTSMEDILSVSPNVQEYLSYFCQPFGVMGPAFICVPPLNDTQIPKRKGFYSPLNEEPLSTIYDSDNDNVGVLVNAQAHANGYKSYIDVSPGGTDADEIGTGPTEEYDPEQHSPTANDYNWEVRRHERELMEQMNRQLPVVAPVQVPQTDDFSWKLNQYRYPNTDAQPKRSKQH
jgi:hypothetical protein